MVGLAGLSTIPSERDGPRTASGPKATDIEDQGYVFVDWADTPDEVEVGEPFRVEARLECTGDEQCNDVLMELYLKDGSNDARVANDQWALVPGAATLRSGSDYLDFNEDPPWLSYVEDVGPSDITVHEPGEYTVVFSGPFTDTTSIAVTGTAISPENIVRASCSTESAVDEGSRIQTEVGWRNDNDVAVIFDATFGIEVGGESSWLHSTDGVEVGAGETANLSQGVDTSRVDVGEVGPGGVDVQVLTGAVNLRLP